MTSYRLLLQDGADSDLDLRAKLEAVQRQAEQFKQQLLAKEQEAEKFRQRLSQIETVEEGDGVVGETTIKVAETTLGVETQTIQRQSYDHARHGRRQAIVSTITTVTLLML